MKFLPLLLLVFVCCKKDEKISQSKVLRVSPDSIELRNPKEEVIPESVKIENKILEINFPDFSVQLKDIEIYDDMTVEENDSTTIHLDLTSSFDFVDVQITDISSEIMKIEAFENYQTTLSISNEGPHVELYDWKKIFRIGKN